MHNLVLLSLGHPKFCHFLNLMIFFLPRNTIGEIIKNVHTVLFQTMKAAVPGSVKL